MKIRIIPDRRLSTIDPKIYGQFIEHFHRQIYGGVYDPGNPLSDEEGFRTDVIEAMRRIKVPIMRWPGGCFVSAYHWKDGVGKNRIPSFNKAWRVPEPNTFGTDEYISLCGKIGCEPYICTNAGTGSAEEMSDWVEYCNLPADTRYAMERRDNGHREPYNVKYGHWEIGAKGASEWGRLVLESAKMMKRTDPYIELSAAALNDMDWNTALLKSCGDRLDWISIHGYWDYHEGKNRLADYDTCMGYISDIERPVRQVRGLLEALGLSHIRIAYDEWNLRAWYHPNIMDAYQGLTPEEYLTPRDDNDINAQYTMADAVFSACFLNMCIRNSDIIGMAAFSPVVNTRGLIYMYEKGIVKRSTYYVFDLYVNELGDEFIDSWCDGETDSRLDTAATISADGKRIAIAAVNTSKEESATLTLSTVEKEYDRYKVITVNGDSCDSYNDIGNEGVTRTEGEWAPIKGDISVETEPHSVNVIVIE